ncbi:MAG TPA: CdaR family protein [Anaerolineales bacterium]|nr:CdaR family protein [Anaerolineales bacterium]HNA88865.1 CdaR family protein [Anaerolineales bacterium]HNB34791.1 CdaR family protein [Anaerolineales bacterium]
MFRWIADNYRTFLWAFALAVAVWISSVTSADPDETRALSSPVEVEVVGQSLDQIINSDIPKEVEITLRAPQSVWKLIDDDPTLVRAILDISGLSSGEHTLDLQIQVNARPVQIISVTPRTVIFTMEPVITKSFDLDLSISGEAAIGYQVGDPLFEPGQVAVAGAQSKVESVRRARVSVILNRIRENYDQSLKVELLDERGQRVDGLTVSPDTIHVVLPVSQQGGYRDVAVKVTTIGRVASGYHLTDISVSPPVVTIYSSDPDLVNTIPGVVETLPLDLQNAQDDITTRLDLNLPAGISVIGEQTVLVQAGVSPIESSVTLSGERIEIIGLEGNLNAQVSPGSVDIILSGPLPLLESLTKQTVRVTVDLTGLAEGTYQLTPKVEVLISNLVVESILPNTVEVVITPLAENTPSPTPAPTATP